MTRDRYLLLAVAMFPIGLFVFWHALTGYVVPNSFDISVACGIFLIVIYSVHKSMRGLATNFEAMRVCWHAGIRIIATLVAFVAGVLIFNFAVWLLMMEPGKISSDLLRPAMFLFQGLIVLVFGLLAVASFTALPFVAFCPDYWWADLEGHQNPKRV